MLELITPKTDFFDEDQEIFITRPEQVLKLEHSLLSVSKWESKWKVTFETLSQNPSQEQIVDYIRCMTINKVNPMIYLCLTNELIASVRDYISDSMTATTFSTNRRRSGRRQIVTSELIYYWMICYNIPFECEKWHLNRLLTLIRVCDSKQQKPSKMSTKEIYNQNRALNEARLKSLKTKG